jgi:hypothetical protein
MLRLEWSLSLSRTGSGIGTVTSDPSGSDCGDTCSASFTDGTAVILTATPPYGSAVKSWAGCASSSGNKCTVIVKSAKSVKVTFALAKPVKLTVTKTRQNKGHGPVTSTDQKIACGADYSESYFLGTPVVLSATPAAGFLFLGWSEPCSGTSTCEVTMDRAKTVKATFIGPQTFGVIISSVKNGKDKVKSSPDGINCSKGTCKVNYPYNTSVTVTATSDTGSSSVGWSPARLCSGTGTCSVTMDKAKTVTAGFTKN